MDLDTIVKWAGAVITIATVLGLVQRALVGSLITQVTAVGASVTEVGSAVKEAVKALNDHTTQIALLHERYGALAKEMDAQLRRMDGLAAHWQHEFRQVQAEILSLQNRRAG